MQRVDSVGVQVIVTSFNEEGLPVGEQVGDPIKLFRASVPDVWAVVDKLFNEAVGKTQGK